MWICMTRHSWHKKRHRGGHQGTGSCIHIVCRVISDNCNHVWRTGPLKWQNTGLLCSPGVCFIKKGVWSQQIRKRRTILKYRRITVDIKEVAIKVAGAVKLRAQSDDCCPSDYGTAGFTGHQLTKLSQRHRTMLLHINFSLGRRRYNHVIFTVVRTFSVFSVFIGRKLE